MPVLTRYLLARMAATLVVAALLLAGLIWILQALRLGHHLLGGASSGAGLLLRLLLYSLPTLLLFVIPVALSAAILHSLDQLDATGELDAMRTAGASPLQLALPAGLLCLAAAAAALLAAGLEAPTLERLKATVRDAAARALVLGARPGRFHDLPGEGVLYARRRIAGDARQVRLEGVLLARGTDLVVARSGSLQVGGTRLTLRLADGELHLSGAHGRLSRVRFKTLEQSLDLGRALRPHFGFLDRRRRHSGATAATVLALGLLACAVALGRASRLRRAVAGLGLTVGYLVAALGLEQIAGVKGVLLLAAGVGVGCLAWLVRASRSGTGSRIAG